MKKILVIVTGISLMLVGCSPWAIAWKTTAGLMEATKTTAMGLDTMGKIAHKKCLEHGTKTPEYASCAKKWIGYLQNWQRYGRTGMRTGVAASYGTIRVAEEAGKKDVDYLAAMKPGVCAAYRSFKGWKDELPDKGKAFLASISWLDTVACERPKQKFSMVASSVVTVISIGLEVAKWVVKILGTPTEELRKQIDTWLRGPVTDATDKLLSDFKADLP